MTSFFTSRLNRIETEKNVSEGAISNYGTFSTTTDYIITEAAGKNNNTIKGTPGAGTTWQALLIGSAGEGNVEGKRIGIYNNSATNTLTLEDQATSTSTVDVGKFAKEYIIPAKEIYRFVHDGTEWVREN